MSSLKVGCSEAAKAMRKAAGWKLASVFYRIFSTISIVLKGEGPDHSDLTFTVTEEWLKINDPAPVQSEEECEKFSQYLEHICKCQCEECAEAKKRVWMVIPYIHPKNPEIPGGAELLLLLHFMQGGSSIILSHHDASRAVEELKPFFLWFTQEPELWAQPPGKKVQAS